MVEKTGAVIRTQQVATEKRPERILLVANRKVIEVLTGASKLLGNAADTRRQISRPRTGTSTSTTAI